MRVGLDTSVLLRLLVGEPEPQAELAWQLVINASERGDELCVSDLVCSETYFALQHHYAVPKAKALAQLALLLDSGEIIPLESSLEVLRTPRLASAKPGFVDRLIHAGYSRQLESVATFERSAAKLRRVRVIGS